MTEKTLEQKLRRTLKTAGYALHKSRIRNIDINDLGGYCIVNLRYNAVVAGNCFQLSLEDVAEWVKELI